MGTNNDDVIYVEGIQVTPDSVTEDGFYIGEDGMWCDIRDMRFSVPECVEGGPYSQQHVMAVMKAGGVYRSCPNCKEPADPDTTIIMLEEFHLFLAADCCKKMVWVVNGGHERFEERMA